jgi:hypothetical protein
MCVPAEKTLCQRRLTGLTLEKTACYSPIVPSLHAVPPFSPPVSGAWGSRATQGICFLYFNERGGLSV